MCNNVQNTFIFSYFLLLFSGGLIVLTMREEYSWEAEEYKNNKLENAIAKMAADGKWKVLLRKIIENFYHDKNGIMFVFERV